MGLFRPMLGENGLTEQQWRVLRALASGSAPMEAGELADTTFLLAPSLSRILATLESRSLIARETPERDRRRSIISLSESGRETVAHIAPYSEAIYRELEEQFGVERLHALIAELDALAKIGPSPSGRPRRGRRAQQLPPAE
jgi:homoprotocatechuate degradation regulator HpaR